MHCSGKEIDDSDVIASSNYAQLLDIKYKVFLIFASIYKNLLYEQYYYYAVAT
jgi:hypothetical protein